MKFFGFFFVIVTNVTTKCYHGYYWTPKMGQNSIKSSFFARRAKKASAKGRSPPQELEALPRSDPTTDDLKSRVEFAGGTTVIRVK